MKSIGLSSTSNKQVQGHALTNTQKISGIISGYYRVNYDTATWKNLTEALKASNYSGIHVVNRAQIVDDSLNLARSGLLDYDLALRNLQYMEQETHYLPWAAFFMNFEYVRWRFTAEQTDVYAVIGDTVVAWTNRSLILIPFQKYVLRLINNAYDFLGFYGRESDTRLDIHNRANILKFACKFGHERCIESALKEFDKFFRQPHNYRFQSFGFLFLRSRFQLLLEY